MSGTKSSSSGTKLPTLGLDPAWKGSVQPNGARFEIKSNSSVEKSAQSDAELKVPKDPKSKRGRNFWLFKSVCQISSLS